MNECPECGAHREWKVRRDTAQHEKRKFLSHPKGGCREYIDNKLKNRCNLFDQDFRTPRTCEQGCERQIYCFENKIGSTLNKIYFDTPGPPWIKHDCKVKQNPVAQADEYRPCVIDDCLACQRFLAFVIQIETDGFREKALIVIQSREDKQQLVRQLHQPFFHKEIPPHIRVLNTYQESLDASGRLLCVPKEYICKKIEHESITGWKDAFGDEQQRSLDF
jgi:hypothetical protein